jgi:hypothetical protein
VVAITGASVTISDVPGVISLRAFARNVGSIDMRVARSLRFGTRLPTLAIHSQSRRPLGSTVGWFYETILPWVGHLVSSSCWPSFSLRCVYRGHERPTASCRIVAGGRSDLAQEDRSDRPIEFN